MKVAFTTGEGNWRDIQPLQPDNFKVNPNYDAIEKSIRVHGFRRAFDVYEDENGVIWSIDGVQRKHVLETRFENVPDILPFNFHKAKDIDEAKIILVNVFNQRESKVNEQVYDDWIPESEDLIGEVDFGFELIDSNIDLDEFFEKDVNFEAKVNMNKIILEYTDEDFKTINTILKEIGGSKEKIFYDCISRHSSHL